MEKSSFLRVCRGIVMTGLLVTLPACGLIPGSDRAGEASVPEFPKETLPPPVPPDPITEFERLAAEEENEPDEEGATAPVGNQVDPTSGATETTTTTLSLSNVSAQCVGLFSLRLSGQQFWDFAPEANKDRRRSLIQQVESDSGKLMAAVNSDERRMLDFTSEFSLLKAMLDDADPTKFNVAFVDFMNRNRAKMTAAFGSLQADCPELAQFGGGEGQLGIQAPPPEALIETFLRPAPAVPASEAGEPPLVGATTTVPAAPGA